MDNFASVKTYGAMGNGINDDSDAFNNAIRENEEIYIPQGTYMIGHTVLLTSNTHITASPLAHIKIMAGAQKGRYDFLLKNSDNEAGNCEISINGGIWDGNCGENDRGDDLFDPKATTGTLFSFRKVKNLTLNNLVLKNPLCYYMRFCESENVKIENIKFNSDVIVGNQDGIHFAGFCKNFVIRNLWGSKGSPNDDFLAFNADDCVTRQESYDLINGPIDNVLVENVYSEKCYCFVRLLSVDSTISNVTVKNVSGSYKSASVNCDAARYCRVPIFKDEDKPNGVGNLRNILLENFSVSTNENADGAAIVLETNCESLKIKNFLLKSSLESPIMKIRKTCKHAINFGDTELKKKYPNEVDYHSDITIKENSFSLFEFKKV